MGGSGREAKIEALNDGSRGKKYKEETDKCLGTQLLL